MAVQTLPLNIDLVIYTGTTFRREFRWLPDGATPVNFTGWHAQMLIGETRGSRSIMALTTENGGITLTAAGQILLGIAPTDTVGMRSGTLIYSLDLTDSSGYVQRFMRGVITVIKDVVPQ